MTDTLIHNAEIVNEGRRFIGYVAIEGSVISAVGEGAPTEALLNNANHCIDAKGALLLPGAIDDQVHFRDPGLTHKADIASESKAAVAGGVTSFMDMPNTKPPTTTLEALNDKYRHAEECSAANFSFFIGGTNQNIDVLKAVDFSSTCGVKLFLGSSTGNMLVDDSNAIARIFAEIPAVIAIHSEDETIIRNNIQLFRQRYGENLPVQYHPLIRSAEACYECTARAVELAHRHGTRLNVLHLSTARALSLFAAATPLADKRVTAEVCVHHLWFSDADYERLGNRIKCNPALKTIDDRNALRKGLVDGHIDIVATDHAPHLLSEKQGNCLTAASGMPLVQFSLVAMLEMAGQGIMSFQQVVEKMCHAPATLYRIKRRGFIRTGYFADLVLLRRDPYTVSSQMILSKCGWSPFEGTSLSWRVDTTFVNGRIAFQNGTASDQTSGCRLQFDV